jgi:xanthine dehydrogenase YagT iron-sulfur-binding subunit
MSMKKSKKPGKFSRSAAGRRPNEKASGSRKGGISRRGFLGTSAAGGAIALTGAEARAAGRAKVLPPKKTTLTLNVNGKDQKVSVEPRVTLLRALRNNLDLTGSKEICDRGACGGCGVIVDGNLVNSCMMLAVDAVGKKVTTIEALSADGKLHPIQAEFVKADALQCGFCTPGMVMACKSLLDKKKDPSLVEIKRGLSGNICRCGTYTRIFAAVQAASKLV